MDKRDEIIEELMEMLACDEYDDITIQVALLLNKERWIDEEMHEVCEDNEEMSRALQESLDEYLETIELPAKTT